MTPAFVPYIFSPCSLFRRRKWLRISIFAPGAASRNLGAAIALYKDFFPASVFRRRKVCLHKAQSRAARRARNAARIGAF